VPLAAGQARGVGSLHSVCAGRGRNLLEELEAQIAVGFDLVEEVVLDVSAEQFHELFALVFGQSLPIGEKPPRPDSCVEPGSVNGSFPLALTPG
jgi:hypothetical protein